MTFAPSMVHFAWTAVYAYACVHFSALHVLRRTDREYLVCGLLCGGLAVFSWGTAMVTASSSLGDAAVGQQFQYAGIFPVTAFFVHFAQMLIGRSRSRTVVLAYAWLAIALPMDLTGLLVDPTRRGAHIHTLAGASHELAFVSPIARVVVLTGLALAGHAAIGLVRRARKDKDVWWTVIAVFLALMAATADFLSSIGVLSWPYLSTHAAMLFVLSVTYVMLRRFVRTEEQLRRRTIELRGSYIELQSMQEELVRKEQLAAVGELSAVIAHEVRNPLAVIKNAVSGLRRPESDVCQQSELLRIIDEESDRLNRMVRDLLAYARPAMPQGRKLDLREVIGRASDVARNHRYGTLDVRWEVDLEAIPETIHGDPDLLHHAFVNLLDNALQAMPSGGALFIHAVATHLEGQRAIAIRVRDDGEGMDALVRDKARDPFFTTRSTGTGLGLAIVERVARAHGGSLEIDSVEGRGTTVTVTLPERRANSSNPPAAA